MEEKNKARERRNSGLRPNKSFNLKKLPKIIFGRSESEHGKDMEISGVIQGSVSKNVSFVVDDKGTLDLSSVPKEFQEVVQKLFEKVSEPKFLGDHQKEEEDDGEEASVAVVRRKGPRVEKGMKDEEILSEMRSLVKPGDPMDFYTKVVTVCINDRFAPIIAWIFKFLFLSTYLGRNTCYIHLISHSNIQFTHSPLEIH